MRFEKISWDMSIATFFLWCMHTHIILSSTYKDHGNLPGVCALFLPCVFWEFRLSELAASTHTCWAHQPALLFFQKGWGSVELVTDLLIYKDIKMVLWRQSPGMESAVLMNCGNSLGSRERHFLAVSVPCGTGCFSLARLESVKVRVLSGIFSLVKKYCPSEQLPWSSFVIAIF